MELMFFCIPREILPPVFNKTKQKKDSREIKEKKYNCSELLPLSTVELTGYRKGQKK
jgi:hypothetical protein